MNICPTCGDEFERLGQHFAVGSCDYPELSDRQHAVINYLIFRGANVRSQNANSLLGTYSTSEQWVRDVADALGWIANDPRIHESATSVADHLTTRYDRYNISADDCSDVWALTTIPHPSLDYDGPTDVERLRPLTARLILTERATFVGELFGSLHVDVRGWDVSSDHLRGLLHDRGISTAEYDGEGCATDTHTVRYHWHPDVIVVPHYDALELLDSVGLSLSDVAEPITLD